MGRVRVRQHVNPLSHKYRQALVMPDWNAVFPGPPRPLHVDIGCARGRFLLAMAQQFPDWGFVGIEIREPLVLEANAIAQDLGLTNLYYLFGNINADPQGVLTALPSPLQRVSIQFPDPWFKQRHSKRRVAQPALVTAIAGALEPEGEVWLQSDVEEVAQEMKDRFGANPAFALTHGESWLSVNPYGVPTEREVACDRLGRPVYRCLFRKLARPPGASPSPDGRVYSSSSLSTSLGG